MSDLKRNELDAQRSERAGGWRISNKAHAPAGNLTTLLGVGAFLLAVFPFGTALDAATYYVANNGRNSGPGTDIAAPWKSIYYAIRDRGAFLQPGDTLYIRGGLYGNSTDRNDIDLGNGVGVSGTAGNPITISAYPGEQPIISIPDHGFYNISLSGKAYFTFSGLNYSNYYGIVLTSITNCVFANCTFGWSPGHGVAETA